MMTYSIRRAIAYVCVLLLWSTASRPTFAEGFPDDSLRALNTPAVADVNMLYIDDTIKAWLDTHIAPVKRAANKATLLHLMLFNPAYRAIRYDAKTTQTALDTWYRGYGNCISLASLYVAAARYVGLNAKFQAVEVPREWREQKDFFVIPGHVNVGIKLPKDTVTVEFANIFNAAESANFKSKKISDHHVLAEYYNNLGMEFLEAGDQKMALAYIAKSLNTYDRIDFVWSNLGVLFKMRRMYTEAEQAYRASLRLNKKNLSTLTNLYILYRQTQQYEASEKLKKRVKRYSKRNPYYLYRLAQSEMKFKNYDSASSLVQRAIDIMPDEAKFHLLLGQIHFATGNFVESFSAIDRAVQTSSNPDDARRYQMKLRAIEKLRAES